jgi:hypothetical protein
VNRTAFGQVAHDLFSEKRITGRAFGNVFGQAVHRSIGAEQLLGERCRLRGAKGSQRDGLCPGDRGQRAAVVRAICDQHY